MALYTGHKLWIAASRQSDRGLAAAATRALNQAFFCVGSPTVPRPQRLHINDENESGKTTHLSEDATGTVVRKDWQNSYEMRADEHNLMFFPYYCLHGDNVTTDPTETDVGQSNVYAHNFTGPHTALGDVESYSMEVYGEPAAVDAYHNIECLKTVVNQFELSYSPSDAMRLTVDLSAGEPKNVAGTPVTLVAVGAEGALKAANYRQGLFVPGNVNVYTSTTVGCDPNEATFGTIGTPSASTAGMTAGVDATPGMRGWTLRGTSAFDADASHGTNDIVLIWSRTSPFQQLEFEITYDIGYLDSTIADNQVNEMLDESDGTNDSRAFAVWLNRTTDLADAGTASYASWLCAMPKVFQYQPPTFSADGLGVNTVTFYYRAQYYDSDGYGWQFLSSIYGLSDYIGPV